MSQHPLTTPAAELDRRFHAFTIDRLIAWLLGGLAASAAYPFLPAEGVAAVLTSVLLVECGLSLFQGRTGFTPGKALLGLRLVHIGSGAPIGVVAATVRSLVLGLSALSTFGLGLAILARTAVVDRGRQRRGWHDRVTGSIVVDVRPTPAEADEVDAGPRHVVNLTALRLVPSSPRPVPAAAPIAPPLGVTTGPARWRVTFDTGESFLVEGLALVGRRPERRPGEPARHVVSLPSRDLTLSKTHAQFQVAPDGALVAMDRGSTNGSVVVRHGVSRDLSAGKPTTLLSDDVVRLGDRTMTVTRES